MILNFAGKRNSIAGILISISLMAIVGSIIQSNKIYREGLSQKTLAMGTNILIRRAAFVNIVKNGLKTNIRSFPSDSFILIGNVDLWSFNKDSGPRYWYNDGSLHVYALSDLRYEAGKPYIHNPIENQVQIYTGSNVEKRFLDPNKLFGFQLSNGKLVRINLQDNKE